MLRIGPHRTGEAKQKGRLASKLCEALDKGDAKGAFHTNNTNVGPPKVVMSAALPGG